MLKVKPQRTCIGCRKIKPKEQLVRVVINKKKQLVIDQKQKLAGRGSYLCKSEARSTKFETNKQCLEKAIKNKAFNYAFKEKIDFTSIPEAASRGGDGPC